MNRYVTDYWINVPATLNLNVLKAHVEEDFPNINAEWQPFPAPGTRVVAGRAVLALRMDRYVTKAQLEALFTRKGVNWTIIGIRSAYPINPVVTGQDANGNDIVEMRYVVPYFAGKAAILPAIADVPDGTYTNGIPNMRRPTVADALNLSHYMGTDPVTL